MQRSILLLAFISNQVAAGTAVINGKSYTCSGSLSVSNSVATCNGKVLTDSKDAGPCGDSPTRKANNGSGQVDVRATVHAEARIDGSVCGTAFIDKSAIIAHGAVVDGAFKIGKGVLIKAGASLNGSGRVGDNVVIGEGATLNGNVNVAHGEIGARTTLNGNINFDGVSVTGGIVCSGNGSVYPTATTDSAR